MEKFDFSGYVTRNNLKCSDGRVILDGAFKHNDGNKVPLVWNHQHNDPMNILGNVLLQHRDDGVYGYGTFNDTESGRAAKQLVEHGDVTAMSIYANQLKQSGSNVSHGEIREVSLVLAGANPGAYIDSIIKHGEESEEEAIIFTGEEFSLAHSEEDDVDEELDDVEEEEDSDEIVHADEPAEEKKTTEDTEDKEETVGDVLNTLTDKQKAVVFGLIGQAREEAETDKKSNDNKEDTEMKHNVFDKEETTQSGVLTHSDQSEIIKLAKQSNVGSLRAAISQYVADNQHLQHASFVDEEGNNAIETLFPDHKLLNPGAPELIERDLSWVDHVLNTIHKSPISRIRTRQADARIAELRAKGYNDRSVAKKLSGSIKLIGRTTDPQTVYRKDEMHRDDIIDITDFDVVEYQWKIMRHNLNEELALAALVGDGREDGDPDKIHESHIRPIWKDDEMYTIHADVDIEAARAELQGTNTSTNFGENYVYAEAIITQALYARENYKGSGSLDFYCTPHLLNVMLLARDLNGRRIYSSISDIAAALNVKSIHTIEQLEGLTRTDESGKEHKLLGLFVNLRDYQFGCAKGGEITKFDDFDIDFNKYKYLMETRLSGSLTKLWSAIALEEPVTAGA